ncbi:MAG: hypothetical protein P1U61_05290 [Legionellaceae bacterium]|nr:hypothetical protein [Legionellaceae bacterium]
MGITSDSFLERTHQRFSEKWDIRAEHANRAYHFFSTPSQPLDKTASWFNPLQRARFESFKSGEVLEDLKSLIFKPIIFFGLRLLETVHFFYYLASFLVYAITGLPTKAVDAGFDALEALVAAPILEAYTFLEVILQIGSFAIRSALSLSALWGSDTMNADNQAYQMDQTAEAMPGL